MGLFQFNLEVSLQVGVARVTLDVKRDNLLRDAVCSQQVITKPDLLLAAFAFGLGGDPQWTPTTLPFSSLTAAFGAKSACKSFGIFAICSLLNFFCFPMTAPVCGSRIISSGAE